MPRPAKKDLAVYQGDDYAWRMRIQQRHDHGGHAQDDVRPGLLDLLQNDARVEQADQHHPASRLQATERDHPAA